MSLIEEKLKIAHTLVGEYKNQELKLLALHSQLANPEKINEASRIFLSEILTYDSNILLQRNMDKLKCLYWKKLQATLDFTHIAPEAYCSYFFYLSDNVTPFDIVNTSKVVKDVFFDNPKSYVNELKKELKSWSVRTQKQGKYCLDLNNLTIGQVQFAIADNLIFNLFKLLSKNMSEIIDWRSKLHSSNYSDLMMVFNGLIEIKLLKRGLISIVFSKKLSSTLESVLTTAGAQLEVMEA
jgi:hypothetical protein